MAQLPTVSALMAAYNYEQYVGRAIQSALEQDYPPDRLEVVVVDDGSTDGTADVVRELAAAHPGRVRLVQQANAGYVAATTRALSEGRGDVLALLDADDVWLPHKTRRQVEMLTAAPDVGMVFADMVVVDGDEQTVRPSLIWHLDGLPERLFARVLYENIATQSSIAIRRELRDAVAPIPDEITYADWWITLRSAMVTQLDYSREPLALYRVHGANLTADPTGAAGVREARKGIAFQLWAMRHLELDQLTAQEADWVWSNTEQRARKLVEAANTMFVEIVAPSPGDAARVDAWLDEAQARRAVGDLDDEARLLLRALAGDPWRPGARERLADAARRAEAAAGASDPLEGTDGYIVLADAEDLFADATLLPAYADAMGGVPELRLAIDATRLEEAEAAQRLQALVERCGLTDRSDLELVAVVGARTEAERTRMLGRVRARYGAGADDTVGHPVFTPATLDELRRAVAGAS